MLAEPLQGFLAEPFPGFLAEPFPGFMPADAEVDRSRAHITPGSQVVGHGADAAGSSAVNPAPLCGGQPGVGG
jgi:hypothetical protein